MILRIPGGEIGNVGERVTSTPKFKVGEYILSFLGKDIDDFYYVNGWEEGKYTFQEGYWINKKSKYSEQFITMIKSIVVQQSK